MSTSELDKHTSYTVLKKAGTDFNLDVAICLAEASQAAYDEREVITLAQWADRAGLTKAGLQQTDLMRFGNGDTKGFWFVFDRVALFVYRGTIRSDITDVMRDLYGIWKEYHRKNVWGSVHAGFMFGMEAALNDLIAFGNKAVAEADYVWLAGHSLGGAEAVLAAMRLKGFQKALTPRIYTFGQPAVQLKDFGVRFEQEMPGFLMRITNGDDIFTRAPPWPYKHFGRRKHIDGGGVLRLAAAADEPDVLDEMKPLDELTMRAASLERVLGGAGASAPVIRSGAPDLQTARPLELVECADQQLTQEEYLELRFGLGAPDGRERSPAMQDSIQELVQRAEGSSPFADHGINEYVSRLRAIRDKPKP